MLNLCSLLMTKVKKILKINIPTGVLSINSNEKKLANEEMLDGYEKHANKNFLVMGDEDSPAINVSNLVLEFPKKLVNYNEKYGKSTFTHEDFVSFCVTSGNDTKVLKTNNILTTPGQTFTVQFSQPNNVQQLYFNLELVTLELNKTNMTKQAKLTAPKVSGKFVKRLSHKCTGFYYISDKNATYAVVEVQRILDGTTLIKHTNSDGSDSVVASDD